MGNIPVPSANLTIAVVVPMREEAAILPSLLEHLERLGADEIVLVDGASVDDSVAIAEAAGFRVVRSEPGRARQMNAGALATEGDVLLFLHADTVLPDGALGAVGTAIAGGADWGRFDVRIVGRAPMLRVVAALMNLRSRLSGIATGDQAIFVRRDAFLAVGGFPEQPLMEDIEISKRLLRRSRPACLRTRVQTSGRRWESRGVWRTIFLMWRLRFAYWRGTPADVLARAYR